VKRAGVFLMISFLFGVLAGQATELTVRVDARDVARMRVHSELVLAVKPGPLTLVFPKWIPGEHGPSGPLDSIIGLEIKANGSRLEWTRDPLDMFSIAITVPAGADHLDISLDSGLSTQETGFTEGRTSSAQLVVLPWNAFVLLPKGRDAEAIDTVASAVPPAGWGTACALASHDLAGGGIELEPVSLARLIDSPVQMGRYMKRIDLPGSAPRPDLSHSIALAADSAVALTVPDDFARGYGRLVAEAGALFGSRLYRHYTWLLTLSDHVAHFGEEHHESSDDRAGEKALSEPGLRHDLAYLLAHEYVHSWNGKYRRPEGLLSPDYQKPMDGSLLWVYEGLTTFWGYVLPARADLLTPQDFRELIATAAGHFDIVSGPRWRPLADTAVQAQVLYGSPPTWESARRSVDFYDASVFLWLDVDSELRERTQGRASLDDFMARFYAGPSGKPMLKPYAEQDVYDTLATIAPGDWRPVLRRHLDVTGTSALMASLERAGWRVTYSAEKNSWVEVLQNVVKMTDREWSIGLRLDEKGLIMDATENRAAARAGAGPGMTIVAVNGRKFSAQVLDVAIAEAQLSGKPIDLLVESSDFFRTLSVAYFDGPRFPHLTRIEGQPDTLTLVVKARTP
jgi:predicted metalloprotease with PDZ domain